MPNDFLFQAKTDAEILQYASEYNLVDNEYFFDRYLSLSEHWTHYNKNLLQLYFSLFFANVDHY